MLINIFRKSFSSGRAQTICVRLFLSLLEAISPSGRRRRRRFCVTMQCSMFCALLKKWEIARKSNKIPLFMSIVCVRIWNLLGQLELNCFAERIKEK